jgi:hypothetical protein
MVGTARRYRLAHCDSRREYRLRHPVVDIAPHDNGPHVHVAVRKKGLQDRVDIGDQFAARIAERHRAALAFLVGMPPLEVARDHVRSVMHDDVLQPGQRARQQQVVRIHKDNIVSARLAQAAVARGRHALVGLAHDADAKVGMALAHRLGQCKGLVARAVIDDEQLVRRTELPGDGRHAGFDKVLRVIRWNDD